MYKLKNYRSVLVIRPDRIGDLTLSLAVPAVIKEICPHVRVDFLVSSYASEVLRYSDYVDDWISYTDNSGNPEPSHKLIEKLASRKYSCAIFLKPNWRSAFSVLMARIPLRIGTSRRAYGLLFNERVKVSRKGSGMHEIDLNLQLLQPFGIKVQPQSINPKLTTANRPWPNRSAFDLPAKYALIHLGSKGSAANWPLANYIKLINGLAESISVVITGQGIETDNVPSKSINLLNKTNFDDLMHLIDGASLFISGGTGPLHLASALGRPLIGFFPNRPHLGPARWGPRGQRAIALTPPEQIGHKCRIKEDGSCKCMAGIEVDLVMKKARSFLE
jgi:ADP-heptose:LPS heptosyltransferase